MKMKKGLGIFAVLLALTVVACNSTPSNGDNEGPASSELPLSTSQRQEKITVTAAGSKTLEVDDTLQLSASVDGVTWTSSNEDVATVDEDGIVLAISYGTATIKASKEGYKDGSISITVQKPAAPHPAAPTWPATCPDLIDTSSWVAGAAEKNSYGKDYIPLTGGDGSVGVKIAMTDYDPKSVGSFDSDGKLGTDAGAYVKFAIKAPKAGVYQMILKASCSESGDDYPFAGESSRGFDVKVNDYEDQDNVYGTRLYTDAGLDHDEKREFIFALVQLNGPAYEDEIQFRNPYYRMKFDTSSYLIFAENK